jgi:hypothetical protein
VCTSIALHASLSYIVFYYPILSCIVLRQVELGTCLKTSIPTLFLAFPTRLWNHMFTHRSTSTHVTLLTHIKSAWTRMCSRGRCSTTCETRLTRHHHTTQHVIISVSSWSTREAILTYICYEELMSNVCGKNGLSVKHVCFTTYLDYMGCCKSHFVKLFGPITNKKTATKSAFLTMKLTIPSTYASWTTPPSDHISRIGQYRTIHDKWPIWMTCGEIILYYG